MHTRQIRAALFVGALLGGLAGLAAPAHAAVTLRVELRNPSCELNGAPAPCTVNADSVVLDTRLNRNDSGAVSAELHYEYTDQGLPLPFHASFQVDPNGFHFMELDHEGGVLYAFSNLCAGARSCPPIPGLDVSGTEAFPPLLLGVNNQPDHLSGVVPLFSTASIAPNGPATFGPVFVRWSAETFASPVPEAASATYLAIGLAMLGLACAAMRRGRGAAWKSSVRPVPGSGGPRTGLRGTARGP